MSAVEPNTSRILEQSVELKTKLLDVVGKHFTDAGDGAFCPEVALSALGSTVLDLFIYMQQLGAPPLGAECAGAGGGCLPDAPVGTDRCGRGRQNRNQGHRGGTCFPARQCFGT